MSARKAKARPNRVTKGQQARKQQRLKDGVASAVKQLRDAQDKLDEIDSLVFVCIQALQTRSGDDVGPNVVAVLSAAYDRLALDVSQNLRDALEALDRVAQKVGAASRGAL